MPDNEYTIRILTGAGAAPAEDAKKSEKELAQASAKLAQARMRLAKDLGMGVGTLLGAAGGGLIGGPVGATAGAIMGAGAGRVAGGFAQRMRRPVAEMTFAELQLPMGQLRLAFERMLSPSQLFARTMLGMGQAVKALPMTLVKLTAGFVKMGAILVSKVVPGMLGLAKVPFKLIGGALSGIAGLGRGALGMGRGALAAVFRPFTQILGDLLGPLKPAAMLMKALKPAFTLMAWAVRPIIAPLRQLLLTMAADFVPVLREIGGMVAAFMSRIGPYILKFTKGFAKGLSTVLKIFTDSEYTFEEFKKTFKGLFTGMMDMVQTGLKFVYDKVKFVFKWIGGQWEALWDTVTNNDIFKWMVEKWHKLFDTLRVGFAHFWNFILDIPLIGRAVQGLGFGKIDIDVMRKVWEAQWSTTKNFVKTTFSDAVGWLGGTLETAFEYRWRTEDERERQKEGRRGQRLGPLRATRALTAAELGVGAEQREWRAGMQGAARVAPGGGVPSGQILDRLLAEQTGGPGAAGLAGAQPRRAMTPEEQNAPVTTVLGKIDTGVKTLPKAIAVALAVLLNPPAAWSWAEQQSEGGL